MPFTDNAGTRIFYEEVGSGDQAVVLLPGLGMSSATWAGAAAEMKQDFRLIMIDPRGSGRSDAPRERYTGEIVNDDVIAVLDAVGIERAHIMGLSMGGMIAQHVAVRHPERVDSLILIATYARADEWVRRLFAVRRDCIETQGINAQAALAILFLTSPGMLERDPSLASGLDDFYSQNPPVRHAYLNQIEFCMEHDTSAQLAELDMPTLCIAGNEDLLAHPALVRETAQLISGAQFALVASAHLLTLERGDRVVSIVRDFLRHLAPTAHVSMMRSALECCHKGWGNPSSLVPWYGCF